MNLTKKYMETQGTLGYLHTKEVNMILLAYVEDNVGAEYKYCYCDAEEADAVIDHWGITGDFIIKKIDWKGTEFMKEEIIKATRVIKLVPENAYFRKNYPPEPTE